MQRLDGFAVQKCYKHVENWINNIASFLFQDSNTCFDLSEISYTKSVMLVDVLINANVIKLQRLQLQLFYNYSTTTTTTILSSLRYEIIRGLPAWACKAHGRRFEQSTQRIKNKGGGILITGGNYGKQSYYSSWRTLLLK